MLDSRLSAPVDPVLKSANTVPEIVVVDQTFRDAHQCLWATRMTTAHMLPVAELMDRIGFQRIEAIAAIQFDVCVRFLKEIPGSACVCCASASRTRR